MVTVNFASRLPLAILQGVGSPPFLSEVSTFAAGGLVTTSKSWLIPRAMVAQPPDERSASASIIVRMWNPRDRRCDPIPAPGARNQPQVLGPARNRAVKPR